MLEQKQVKDIDILQDYLNVMNKKLITISQFVENMMIFELNENISEDCTVYLVPQSKSDSNTLIFTAKIANWEMLVTCSPTYYYFECNELGEQPIKIPFQYSISDRTDQLEILTIGLQHSIPNITFDTVTNFVELLNDLCTIYRLTDSAYKHFSGNSDVGVIHQIINKNIELNNNVSVIMDLGKIKRINLTNFYIRFRNKIPKLLSSFTKMCNGQFQYDLDNGVMIKMGLWQ